MSADNFDFGVFNVFILGPLTLQNEFLSYVIHKEVGCTCSIFDRELNTFMVAKDSDNRDNGSNNLILIDTEDQSFEEIIKSITTNSSISNGIIALFNVNEETGVEKKALSRNIRGFFYKDDHLEIFVKGIRSIILGEIWVSRKMLLKCIFELFSEKKSAIEEKTTLTSREIEILALVSMGSSNEEIADKVCISPNTVKTHLYNIFKKINVQNRLQAALWAAANL